MTPPWAQDVVRRTTHALEDAADPDRAPLMSAYMRDRFPFLGIGTPLRRSVLRQAWDGLPVPSPAEVGVAAGALWQLPCREYQYAACDLLGVHLGTARRARRYPPRFLTEVVRPLVVEKAWWDTVDSLRSVAVGPLVEAHRELVTTMRAWSRSQERWLVRSALIHQLGYRGRTDEALLLDLCAEHAGDREFFVAKAVGWALRTYARTAPDVVRRFCAEHPELSPLARREALKHL